MKMKNIEFLRFIFALSIVFFHLMTRQSYLAKTFTNIALYKDFTNSTAKAYICVDFFFIIAGFLLMLNFKNEISILDFIKKKIIRLWPVVGFALLICLVLSAFKILELRKYEVFFDVLLLNNIGITLKGGYNGASWFVSALFFASLFYFYIIKNFTKKHVDFVVALLILFCYNMLLQNSKGHFGGVIFNIGYVFNIGLLRAIGGMGIGYFKSQT